MRKYYIHLITSKLIKENDMIVTEDLSVKKMIEEAKVKHFSKYISSGHKNSEVKDLRIREWICEECENRNDRDLNASMNLLEMGLKYYMEEYIRG